MKKTVSLVLVLTLLLSIFSTVLNVSAATPAERVEVILEGDYDYITWLGGDLYKIENAQGEGLFSATQGWLSECQWYSIYDTSVPSLFIVHGKDGYGIIDNEGNTVVSAVWDGIYIESGVALICKDDLWGLSDLRNNVLIEPQFDSIGVFNDGIAVVYKNEKAGFINTAGRIISDTVWASAQDFSDSYAAVKDSNGKCGFVDTNGNVVIDCQFENVSAFYQGYAVVLENGIYYVINKNGEKIIRNGKYLNIHSEVDCDGFLTKIKFSGSKKNVACIKLAGEENYCYIDSNFNILTESKYKYDIMFNDNDYAIIIAPDRFGTEKYCVLVIDMSNGVALKEIISEKKIIKDIEFSGNYFFEADDRLYDFSGKDLFGMKFDKYIYHYDNSSIINGYIKGKYACVNFNGDIISGLSEYQFYYINDNLYLAVADDGRVKLCDKNGKLISETHKYADAYVSNGYIYVKNNSGKWGLCDTDGSVILEPKYDKLYEISDGMLKFKNKGKFGFVNMKNFDVIEAEFSNAAEFSEGFCWVSEDVLIGTIDKNGNYIIDPLYWGYNDCTGFGANRFSYGVTSLQKDKHGKHGVVNTKGEKVLDFTYEYIGAFNSYGVAAFDKIEDGKLNRGLMRVVSNTATDKPTKIITDKSEINTYVGCYEVITETVLPASSADLGVSFASTNESVATVDKLGRVYGVSEGNTIIVIVSNADTSIVAAVSVRVEDRELHNPQDLIPETAWEEQNWLSDYVINQLAVFGEQKTADKLTYGDLLKITEINITDIADPGTDIVYHIPDILGEFSNLISININPDIFFPLISTMPETQKFLCNLYNVNIYNTYGDSVNDDIVRNNADGIPSAELYKALAGTTPACVRKDATYNSLRWKNITDLTGLSNMNYNSYSTIDLSCNYISDISELRKLNRVQSIDLQYNRLDLEDEETLSVLQELEEKGVTVLYDHQNEITAEFYEYQITDWWEDLTISENNKFSIMLDDYGYYYYESKFLFKPFPAERIDDFVIATTDSSVAEARIEYFKDGLYEVVCDENGIGTADFYLMDKTTGKILKEYDVDVLDLRNYLEDIKVSYSVSEYNPTYAYLNIDNYYKYCQYRKLGEETWNYGMCIEENGTYEIRYCNYGGVFSNIAVLEITGIKKELSKEFFPDNNLYQALLSSNSTLYEGIKISYLYASNKNIFDLTGLSLLDFSDFNSSILNLSFNYISDISELAKLNIKNLTIDLSYNKIDFTLPHNAQALRQLFLKGCTVIMDNQFYNGAYLIGDDVISYPFTGTGNYSYPLNIYQADGNITLRRDNPVIPIVSISKELNRFWIYVDFKDFHGEEYVDILYNGELFKTVLIKRSSLVNVHYYSQIDGYYMSFEYYGNNNCYRKVGDSEWKNAPYSLSIKEDGNYEFKYEDYSGRSYITTLELKTTSHNGQRYYLKNGEWHFYGFEPNTSTEVIVPEAIDGYPVTDISGMLDGNMIKSITIPKTVKNIGYISNSSIEELSLSSENNEYYLENNMLIKKSDMAIIWISPSVQNELRIPDGISKIDISIAYNVTKLHLSKDVSYVNLSDFPALENLTIDIDNPFLFVKDGLLYERYTGKLLGALKTLTESVEILEGTLFIASNAFSNLNFKKVTIPSSVIEIGNSAFYQSSIEELELSYGILKIGSQAFYDCNKLTNIYIPSSVQSIANFAFYSCDLLTRLSIAPGVEQIGYNICNGKTTIYCIRDSSAHIYAQNHGYKYCLIDTGDMDYDGEVSANDIVVLRKELLLNRPLTDSELLIYDVNDDGKFDVRDLVRIKKNLAAS